MIQWCMDRKQEIQNQIAELQRELAGMESKVLFCAAELNSDNAEIYSTKTKSFHDVDVIEAIQKHESIHYFRDSDIDVWPHGSDRSLSKTFHVTRNVSYNITPF